MSVDPAAIFIAFSVIDGLAIILTLFRLFVRLQIRRFWWEDAWAVVAFVCGTVFFVNQFISSETDSYETALITSFMASSTFTSTVWAVRMSLLYSTIRIISPSSILRKFARVFAVLTFLFWTTSIVLKVWWCVNNTKSLPKSANRKKLPICYLPELIIFFKLITDCISDAVLVILPLKLLWKVKLPRRQRRMILILFSSSVVMTIFSLLHAIFQLVPELTIGFVVAFNLQMASALIVCNLLVLVTYMYRVILSSPNESLPSESDSSSEDDDFTTRTPIRRTTEFLTTVELNTLDIATDSEATHSNFTSGIVSLGYRSSVA